MSEYSRRLSYDRAKCGCAFTTWGDPTRGVNKVSVLNLVSCPDPNCETKKILRKKAKELNFIIMGDNKP